MDQSIIGIAYINTIRFTNFHQYKMSLHWSKSREKCKGYDHLFKEFEKFVASGRKEGIDAQTALSLKPKEVKEKIYNPDPVLRQFKRERFPDNFRDCVNSFHIDQKKTQARRKGKFHFI